MRLNDILTFLNKKGTAGATLDEFKNELGDEDMDTMKRLLNAGMDLGEIKKDGKGRGLKYYGIDFEIVKIIVGPKQKHGNLVEEIDVTECKTVREKILKVLASDYKLKGLHKFSYREKLEDKELNRDLYDFIHKGALDIDVNVACKDKNYIVSKPTKLVSNKLVIQRTNLNEWTISKHFFECLDRPEVTTFTKYEEFEKCLRTLLSRQ